MRGSIPSTRTCSVGSWLECTYLLVPRLFSRDNTTRNVKATEDLRGKVHENREEELQERWKKQVEETKKALKDLSEEDMEYLFCRQSKSNDSSYAGSPMTKDKAPPIPDDAIVQSSEGLEYNSVGYNSPEIPTRHLYVGQLLCS